MKLSSCFSLWYVSISSSKTDPKGVSVEKGTNFRYRGELLILTNTAKELKDCQNLLKKDFRENNSRNTNTELQKNELHKIKADKNVERIAVFEKSKNQTDSVKTN